MLCTTHNDLAFEFLALAYCCPTGVEASDDGECVLVEYVPRESVLILDTRLQDIAEAWTNGGPFTSKQYVRDCWPELAALLDAFTQEDNDG